jgi:DNA primase
MHTTAAPAIDFEAVAVMVDLEHTITDALGSPNRERKWLCPFHDDHHPSLTLTPDRRHWKCWSCGASGDVLDWLVAYEHIDLIEAVRRIDPAAVGPRPRAKSPTSPAGASAAKRPPRPPSAPPEPVWHDPTWQATVDAIVTEAEHRLWSAAGRPALDWLRARGLTDHTLARFRVGFVPRDFTTEPIEALGLDKHGEPRGIWVRRGVAFPWIAPGAVYTAREECARRWVGANVRRLAVDVFAPVDRPKCWAFAGSARGVLYPWPDVLATQGVRPAVLVEGEIDALIGEQEAGHVVLVGTVGGARQAPHRSALLALVRCPAWLLGFDHDDAGVEAAREWHARAPHKARRVMLPHGKDLGKFVEHGGDVRGWLAGELARIATIPAAR